MIETKRYKDGTSATGTAPLPDQSPDEQAIPQTTDLKPCPFCGSDKVSVSRNTWSDGREGRYVECENCEAASGSWPIGSANAERASELAARKWNARSGRE
jgi:Lar family restriction alleviation protein